MAESTDGASNGSVSTFVSSLVFNVVLAAAILIAFCVLRPRFKRVYAPRTYAVEKEKRSQAIGGGVLAWIPAVLRLQEDKIIERVGLDTYMFLRYMRSMFVIFTVLSVLSLVTILPVHLTGGQNVTGMAVLTIANVDPESKNLWVHIVFFMVFVAWVMRNIFLELQVYTRLRIWWLTNPHHSAKVGASTIMVSPLPQALADSDERIQATFDLFPGGVRQVVVNRDCSALAELIEKRDGYAAKLEGLLTSYAVANEKARQKAAAKGTPPKEIKRPTMRESKVPFKGPKLDAFEFLSTQIGELNQQIADLGKDATQFKRKSSAFVLFRKQLAAHMAAQTVLDYHPFSMNTVSLDVNPDDVIWGNLNLNPYDRSIRGYISLGITVGLVIVWSLLTAALTTLVSIQNLKKLPGLKDMTDSPFLGIFTGIIPAVLVAVVMALLPIILRLLLRLEGTPRKSEIELRLLNRFYFFQVWNVYLITIFTSSILTIAANGFNDPSSIIKLVPEKVPESATPILTYILLLAFTGAAKEILQMTSLALRYILPILFAKTPRKICAAEAPSEFDWGTTIPTHSLIFLMGFSYSFVSPIVNCFAAVYFGLFYLIYRYQFLYVYSDANWATGGLSFPKAVSQTMVGVYISEVYMLLMMLAKLANNNNINANAILRVIFPALILLATIFSHIYIKNAYMPIVNYLPVRAAADIERNPKIAAAFPDVSGGKDLECAVDPSVTEEDRVRQLMYATYGSLVPRKVIDYVLTKLPRLLRPGHGGARPDPARPDTFSGEEEGKQGAQSPKAPEVLVTDSGAAMPMPSPHHYAADGSPEGAGASVHSLSSATHLRQRRAAPERAAGSPDGQGRYSMVDTDLLASAGDNALAEAFSNPALRAKATTVVWVPLDTHGVCNALYADVQRWGAGTINVVTDGTWIDGRCRVKADVDFDADSAAPRPA